MIRRIRCALGFHPRLRRTGLKLYNGYSLLWCWHCGLMRVSVTLTEIEVGHVE
jgi:hypothetical protein